MRSVSPWAYPRRIITTSLTGGVSLQEIAVSTEALLAANSRPGLSSSHPTVYQRDTLAISFLIWPVNLRVSNPRAQRKRDGDDVKLPSEVDKREAWHDSTPPGPRLLANIEAFDKDGPWKSLTNCLIHMGVWYFLNCTRALGFVKRGSKPGSNKPSPQVNQVGG
jgi:hypothetical protein